MKREEWKQIKEVLWLALAQPTGSREDFLHEKYGSQPQLIAEVKSLLEANKDENLLLENENYNIAAAIKKNSEFYEGKIFGNYRIIREVGRGGMGAVFLAERADEEFSQKVALKIIRQSFADPELAKQFRRERQILASLNHPNIAVLHDGGVTEFGEPFLVMEFVEGKPLLEFVNEQNFSIEKRLDLFLKICAAVSYAHQNLIVHRDIKPNNILVAKNGEPKLLDFGLAKVIDDNFDAEQTKTAYRAFTPSYASPEQIHGKNITTASDVYSLGIVLYELLTGQNPFQFESKSFDEIVETIDLKEPLRPSSVIGNTAENVKNHQIQNPKLLKGDLDNITLKALQKEPARRYKSVDELAADIKRHLQNLPVLARPNSFSYRASRFFRRNKIVVSAISLIILALAASLAITLWQANETRKERDRAERRFEDIRKLSNSLLFELSPKLERLQGSTEAREILVKNALEYLDNLAKEEENDLSLQSELAAAYEKIADLQGSPRKANLGDFSGAVNSFEKAQFIRKSLIEKKSDENNQKRGLAANFAALSNIRFWMNDFTSSLHDSEKALELYEQLLFDQPDSIELKLSQIDLQLETAFIYYFNNEIPKSYPYFQKSLAALENLNAQQPNNPEILRLFGKGYTAIGSAYSWDDKQKEGEAAMEKALAINELLVENNPNDVVLKQNLLRTYFECAGIYDGINNKLFLTYIQKAVSLGESLVQNDVVDTQAKQDLAKSYSKLGIAFLRMKKYEEANIYFDKSQVILTEIEKTAPENLTYKFDLARNYVNIGVLKNKEKDLISSLDNFRHALSIYEILTQKDEKNNVAKQQIGTVFRYMAESYEAAARNEKNKKSNEFLNLAELNFQKALEIYQQLNEQNKLTEFDKKYLNEIKSAVVRYSADNK